MASITTRVDGAGQSGVTVKGAPLTNSEIDQNFLSLNNNKLESSWTGNESIVTLGTVSTGTWNATTIAINKGGTGATDAATARTNLGLAIGTNVQAYDADLTAVAALSTTGIISRTATGAMSTRTITAGTGISVSNGDGVSGNPTVTNSGVLSLNGQTGAITGFTGATGGGSDSAFFLNDVIITTSYTIPLNKNAMTAGPVTISTGATVTIPDGSVWTVI